MSVRNVSKLDMETAGFQPTPENVQDYLVSETGVLVVDGKILDRGDFYEVPVFSADGRSIPRSEAGAGRCMYRVIADGVCTDETKFRTEKGEIEYVEFKFPKRLGFKVGSRFSARVAQGTSLSDDPNTGDEIFLEFAPDEYGRIVPIKAEREEFESAGIEKGPSWAPAPGGTPHNALNGGHPDSGDSRARAAWEASQVSQISPARITEESFNYSPTEIVLECLKAWNEVKKALL